MEKIAHKGTNVDYQSSDVILNVVSIYAKNFNIETRVAVFEIR
jgi:hypothetical protein